MDGARFRCQRSRDGGRNAYPRYLSTTRIAVYAYMLELPEKCRARV